MSNDDPEDAPSDDAPEPDDDQADTADDEQPEIDDDEMADFSSVADDIEDAAGADPDDENDDQEDNDDEVSGDEMPSFDNFDKSPGHIYCRTLGLGAAVAKKNHGSEDIGDLEDAVTEYSELAKVTEVDEFVDEYLEQTAGLEELSPGQGIVVGTLMFGMMVLVEDPEILDGLAQKADGLKGGSEA